jgi:hypothetical protein
MRESAALHFYVQTSAFEKSAAPALSCIPTPSRRKPVKACSKDDIGETS